MEVWKYGGVEGGASSAPTLPHFHTSTPPHTGETARALPPIRAALCLFVFSLLFEGYALGPVDPATAATALLLGASLLQPRLCFRRPPAAIWLFGVYIWVCVVYAAVTGAPRDAFYQALVHADLVVVCWISLNLMREERTARAALLSLVASCVVAGILTQVGLVPKNEGVHRLSSRLTLGLDPNQVGGLLSLGLLSLVGLTYGLRESALRPRWLTWPLFALIGFTIIKAGSRGALIALAVGLAILLIRGETPWIRLRNSAIILAGLGFFVWAGLQSGSLLRRVERTVESGDMALREATYPIALGMFLEKPVAGWGTFTNTLEIGRRLNHPAYPRMDTHNLVLYLVTSTGLIGAVPFLIGIGLCINAAWRGRAGPHGILALALTITLLLCDMSVSGLHWKQHWLIIAYALASGTFVPGKRADRRVWQ